MPPLLARRPRSRLTAEAQVTGAERVLIRALASATEMQASGARSSSRDGAEEEFDPARQAQFALQSEHLYEGLASQSLIETLLEAGQRNGGRDGVAQNGRRSPAAGCDPDERRRRPEPGNRRRSGAGIAEDLLSAAAGGSAAGIAAFGALDAGKQVLLQEKVRLKRALMDPGLGEKAS